MNITKRTRKPLVNYHLQNLAYGIATGAVLAVLTQYLLERGLTYTQIGGVWGAFLIAQAVVDFPTGNFADKYGRIKAHIMGMSLLAIGQFIWSTEYVNLYYIGGFFVGSGLAQITGSLNAWIVDAVGEKDYEKLSKIFGAGRGLQSTGTIIAGVTLFILLNRGFPLVIAFYIGISTLIVFICVNFLFEDNKGSPKETWIQIIKNSFRIYKNKHHLPVITFGSAMVFGLFGLNLIVWQPRTMEILHSEYYFGILLVITTIGEGVGAGVFGKLGKYRKPYLFLSISTLILAVSISIMLLFNSPISLGLGIFFVGVGFGSAFPTILSWVNELIPSEYRASIISLVFTIVTGTQGPLQILYGGIIDILGWGGAIIVGWVLSLLGIVVLLSFGKNAKHSKKR